jgi:microcystin-dependent protein
VAVFDLVQIEAIASDGGYGGLCLLSNRSALIILSAMVLIQDLRLWQGVDDYILTADEQDAIEEYIARITFEVQSSMIGTVLPFANSVTPTGMLLCDGTQYLREDYPELYDVIDTAFVVDSDNFTVPNLQNLFVKGKNSDSVGDTGGNSSISLGYNELPVHSHTYAAHTLTPVTIGAGAPILVYTPPDIPVATTNAGSGNSFDNRPPYLVLQYGIVSGRP